MAVLTEAQEAVLKVLANHQTSLPGPGYIGSEVWGKPSRKPQSYARVAGRVLKALRDKGYVVWWYEKDYGRGGWRITKAGRDILGGS